MKKKITVAILMLALSAGVYGQGKKVPFTLTGKFSRLTEPGRVLMKYRTSDTAIIDSVDVVNGSFQFKGVVSAPVIAYLQLKLARNSATDNKFSAGMLRGDQKQFYLEGGVDFLVSAESDIKTAVIKGGPVQDDADAFSKELMGTALVKEIQALNDSLKVLMTGTDTVQVASVYTRLKDELSPMLQQMMMKYYRSHPDSYLTLMAIAGMDVSGPVTDTLYRSLSNRLKGTATGLKIKADLDLQRGLVIGKKAPDFSQADTTGVKISLSSFLGRYVLIDFWASWCAPCRAENPVVVKAYETYKNKGFTVLGISLDSKAQKLAWLKAIEKDRLNWTQVSDLKGWGNEVAKLYAVKSIPQNFLIDPNGIIVAKNLRGADLEKKLSEIFK